ncbi:MAG: hypothetical protein JXP34_12345, partial [Planctomycetes bacterium]|nr:hypothetical protein [Planctomycetota bacterium]
MGLACFLSGIDTLVCPAPAADLDGDGLEDVLSSARRPGSRFADSSSGADRAPSRRSNEKRSSARSVRAGFSSTGGSTFLYFFGVS